MQILGLLVPKKIMSIVGNGGSTWRDHQVVVTVMSSLRQQGAVLVGPKGRQEAE